MISPHIQSCSKCGSKNVSREYRKRGQDVRLSFGESGSECTSKPPFLKSDWPYGWTVTKEHIGHHCRECGFEWESKTRK